MIGRNLDPNVASKVLSKTMFKELRKMKFSDVDIINFSKMMIDHLAEDIKNKSNEEISHKQVVNA
jgi:hypothetical protein